MEKTVTFTMEDALISPVGLAVLSGAGLLENVKDGDNGGAIMHATETAEVVATSTGLPVVGINYKPYIKASKLYYAYAIPLDSHGDIKGQPVRLTLDTAVDDPTIDVTDFDYDLNLSAAFTLSTESNSYSGDLEEGDLVMIDYYYESKDKVVTQLNIDVENFAGYYYLEAETLWRTKDGVDLPAEFIIPNCKIQSAFTFTMASSGDPSTFTFTIDAFPDYTKYDSTTKVLCAIRVVEDDTNDDDDLESVAVEYDENAETTDEESTYSDQTQPAASSGSASNWRARAAAAASQTTKTE